MADHQEFATGYCVYQENGQVAKGLDRTVESFHRGVLKRNHSRVFWRLIKSLLSKPRVLKKESRSVESHFTEV